MLYCLATEAQKVLVLFYILELVFEAACSLPCRTSAVHFVGELQAAFVMFVYGQLLPAFEQWKAIVIALCRSEDGLLACLHVAADGSGSTDLRDLYTLCLPALTEQVCDMMCSHGKCLNSEDTHVYLGRM